MQDLIRLIRQRNGIGQVTVDSVACSWNGLFRGIHSFLWNFRFRENGVFGEYIFRELS